MDAKPTISASKLKILHATARVAKAMGASNITLERIAEEAGISKGGLLYHYPNKRALLEGMLDHSIAQVEDRLVSAEQGPVTLADFVLVTTQSAQDRAISQSLLAAAAVDPELMKPARTIVARWLKLATAHSPQAQLIFLASEGVRFLDLLDLLPSAAAHTSILKTLASAGLDDVEERAKPKPATNAANKKTGRK